MVDVRGKKWEISWERKKKKKKDGGCVDGNDDDVNGMIFYDNGMEIVDKQKRKIEREKIILGEVMVGTVWPTQ